MSTIVIDNTKYIICQKYYRYIFRMGLKEVGLSKNASLIFVDNKSIKMYNKEYRKKDKATDILTFTYDDDDNDDYYAGDLMISYEWVIKEYKKEKIKESLSMLILHGVLHLKGVHHTYSPSSLKENWGKMEKIYKEILKKKKNYETEK